ncbi:MAG: XRE family transcriptional regulator [Thermoleophilaceae bacterium]
MPTDATTLHAAEQAIARRVVLIDAGEMAGFLQQHLGQKLTAYLAGIKDAKAVGQWAQGRADPSAIVRERLRAAYHVTALFAAAYGDRAAQAWFFGANSALGDQAPAATLRTAETPEEIARVVPLARAFVRSAL